MSVRVPVLFLGVFAAVQSATAADAFEKTVQPFLARHCIACHGAKSPRGGLRLDTLPASLNTPAARDAWKTIAERVRAGEMPPAKRPRPPAGEIAAALKWIDQGLIAADAVRRAKEGRTAVRRLNRIEYANTLRDLLGVVAPLAELLPEDGSAHGFDTVGDALTLSPVLMERYLEAADVVLDAAIAPARRVTSKVRRVAYKSIKGMPEKIRGGSFINETPDAAVLHHDGYTPYDVREFWGSPPGRYRIRISAYAHNSGGKPLLMRVYVGNFIPNAGKSHLAGIFEVPAGKPRVVEFEDRFTVMHDTVKPIPYDCGNPWRNDGSISKHTGPGLAVQWIELEGPLDEPHPLRSQTLLFGPNPEKGTMADATKLLRGFLPTLFRRPVTDAEVQRYARFAEAKLKAGGSFIDAMRMAWKVALCSPHFLFLRAEPGELDGHALASRLSYFLWSSCPDDALTAAAARGDLGKSAGLRAQVERMLADPKASRFTENFTGQWLGLRNIDFTTPDPRLYPEYDEVLRDAMLRETQMFFDEILHKDRSLLEFVHSDWTMLNQRLARHYGIPGVEGHAFRKVALKPEWRRGGVLSHASVLKVTANGTTTSPVLRGVWVLDRILGTPAPAPPANVPAVEPDIRGATTIRQQLAKHRTIESCASCHTRIDPPGFALENYDVIGGWRERYRISGWPRRPADALLLTAQGRERRLALGLKVDAGDVTPAGQRFADLDQYKQILLKDPDPLARSLADRLLTYATGHPAEAADRAEIETIVARIRERKYGFRALLHEITQSRAFRQK